MGPTSSAWDFRKGIIVLSRGLRGAFAAGYSSKGLSTDGAYAHPQAVVHLRSNSATIDGLAAVTVGAYKCAHYARQGLVPFDERSFKLGTSAEESKTGTPSPCTRNYGTGCDLEESGPV